MRRAVVRRSREVGRPARSAAGAGARTSGRAMSRDRRTMTSASSSRGSSTPTPSRMSRPRASAASASSDMIAPAPASTGTRSGKRASGKRRSASAGSSQLVVLADRRPARQAWSSTPWPYSMSPVGRSGDGSSRSPLLDRAQREPHVVDLAVAAPEDARAAGRRPERRADPVALVDGDREAVPGKRPRGAQADDARPDDGGPVRQPAPPFGPARPSGRARSRCRSRRRARRR